MGPILYIYTNEWSYINIHNLIKVVPSFIKKKKKGNSRGDN